MDTQIIEAIRNRQLLSLRYKGGARTVEPYCYGISRSREEVLRAYQLKGTSLSGESEGWKMFSIKSITSLEVLSEKFDTVRPEYNPRDRDMVSIFAAVK